MMEQYSGSFLSGVEGLRALLGCRGRVWPVSIEQASLCARYADGSTARGEVDVDAHLDRGHAIEDIWLDPPVQIHREVAAAIAEFEAVIIGPGSFFTSLMPIFAVQGVPEALAQARGPLVLIANLLTEGDGMRGFTAGDAVRLIGQAAGRPVDAVVFNEARPSAEVLGRYAAEHKRPLELGSLPSHCTLVSGRFWRKDIARHDRPRLAHALWAVLASSLDRRARPRL
jgi:uncharacterized cofD-like protein